MNPITCKDPGLTILHNCLELGESDYAGRTLLLIFIIDTLYLSYTLHHPHSDIAHRRIYYYHQPPLAPEFAVAGSGTAFTARPSSFRVQIDLV